MGKIYEQLSIEERTMIQTQLEMGIKRSQIASRLNRSPSTITRELQRNGWVRPKVPRGPGRPTVAGGYRAEAAHKRAHACTVKPFVERRLEVEHIIVLGHSQCGGIRALVTGTTGEFIPQWMSIAREARDNVLYKLPGKSPALQARACEQAGILLSLKNLLTFPWIKERVEQGGLALHGW